MTDFVIVICYNIKRGFIHIIEEKNRGLIMQENFIEVLDSVTQIGENAFLDVPNVNYNGTAEGSPWGAKKLNGVEV